MRTVLFLCLAVVAGGCHASISDRYDNHIRAAAERWLPGWDWRWWKAQLHQESLLRPDVCSHAGACGIAQFMPATWREVSTQLRLPAGTTPFHAEAAIDAGAFYMRRMRAVWTSERSEEDRRALAQASYNAGSGNILRAQRVCIAETRASCRTWAEVAQHLHRVTGRHHAETLTYVQRIRRWYLQL